MRWPALFSAWPFTFIAEVEWVTPLETEAAPQRFIIPGPLTRHSQNPVTLLSVTENYTRCSPDRKATASESSFCSGVEED